MYDGIVIASILLLVFCREIRPQSQEYWNRVAQEELEEALNQKTKDQVAKNVILFIGDGMDITTITASRIYAGQLKNEPGEENLLNFEKFPYVALSKTYATDRQTPESAGTATALLCGIKTNYGLIGVDSSAIAMNCTSTKGAEVDSILYWSHQEGKSTGIVTTSRITHGTPAAAYAHSAFRYWEGDKDLPEEGGCKDIAYQLVHNNSYINVIFGGGRNSFFSQNELDPETGEENGYYGRRDDRNLIEDWKSEKESRKVSYEYVWNKKQFDDINGKKTDYVLGLFEPSHMKYEYQRNDDEDGDPSLPEMTRKSIEILQKNKEGFFLMVEGARIDSAHHSNTAKAALEETVVLDKAIEVAIEMTKEKDTLIIVTADHGHNFNMGSSAKRGDNILGVAEPSSGQSPDGFPYTTLSYGNGPGYDWGERTEITEEETASDGYIQKSAVPLRWEMHGGQDVPIYARGPMAHLFHGVHEQNYVAHVMAYASCVARNKNHCR